MKKILVASIIGMVLTGCATKMPIAEEQRDIEPQLVDLPIDTLIDNSFKKIKEQEDLIAKIEKQKQIKNFEVVQHNNGLDARLKSKNTIPESYAYKEETKKRLDIENMKKQNEEKINKILNTKVKNIEWMEDSANNLGMMFAKSLGYEFKANGKDIKITFMVKGITLQEAINKYVRLIQLSGGNVYIDKENKKINVNY